MRPIPRRGGRSRPIASLERIGGMGLPCAGLSYAGPAFPAPVARTAASPHHRIDRGLSVNPSGGIMNGVLHRVDRPRTPICGGRRCTRRESGLPPPCGKGAFQQRKPAAAAFAIQKNDVRPPPPVHRRPYTARRCPGYRFDPMEGVVDGAYPNPGKLFREVPARSVGARQPNVTSSGPSAMDVVFSDPMG